MLSEVFLAKLISIRMRMNPLDLEPAQRDVERGLLEPSRVSPLEEDRLEFLDAEMLVTILVEQSKNDVDDVLADVLIGYPARDVVELVPCDAVLLCVKEEHGALQVGAAK